MKCRVCGGSLESRIADLPFRLGDHSIAIIKSRPLLQCPQCGDTELETPTRQKVEQLLAGFDGASELEVIRFEA